MLTCFIALYPALHALNCFSPLYLAYARRIPLSSFMPDSPFFPPSLLRARLSVFALLILLCPVMPNFPAFTNLCSTCPYFLSLCPTYSHFSHPPLWKLGFSHSRLSKLRFPIPGLPQPSFLHFVFPQYAFVATAFIKIRFHSSTFSNTCFSSSAVMKTFLVGFTYTYDLGITPVRSQAGGYLTSKNIL